MGDETTNPATSTEAATVDTAGEKEAETQSQDAIGSLTQRIDSFEEKLNAILQFAEGRGSQSTPEEGETNAGDANLVLEVPEEEEYRGQKEERQILNLLIKENRDLRRQVEGIGKKGEQVELARVDREFFGAHPELREGTRGQEFARAAEAILEPKEFREAVLAYMEKQSRRPTPSADERRAGVTQPSKSVAGATKPAIFQGYKSIEQMTREFKRNVKEKLGGK